MLLFGDTGQPGKNLTTFVKRVGSAPRRSWGLGCRSLPRRRCKGLPLLAFGRPTTAPEELASHIHVYALKRALTASSLARMYARRDPDYNSAFEERLAERPGARARNMTLRKPPRPAEHPLGRVAYRSRSATGWSRRKRSGSRQDVRTVRTFLTVIEEEMKKAGRAIASRPALRLHLPHALRPSVSSERPGLQMR